MALKAGIVGLPNVGKSTLFNAITNSQVEAANYPFATIEPNVGIVELRDERLEAIAKIVKPHKIVRATFEFIDIAGLVAGASQGEGLGNKFLANIREVDAIIQVVRCFEAPDVTHVPGSVDPLRDIDIINIELLLADMETVENVIRRVSRKAQNDKVAGEELAVASLLKEFFAKGTPTRLIDLSPEQKKIAAPWQLLTSKPMLFVGNVDEKHAGKPEESAFFQKMVEEAKRQNAGYIGISAKTEYELAQLEEVDRALFLEDLGIKLSGLDVLTRASFNLLNLATYFTAGVTEVRAWTFLKGYNAQRCAGIIHSDFEKGFIKAEVIAYEDYVAHNGELGARNAGKLRLEGKEYLMKDGDIVHFRFNV